MPRLSIVTINRNDAAGLAVTGASIAALRWRNFEWLVIDGASTDDSVEVARRCGADRLVSEPDGGRYEAMNKGIALAGGDYLIFMNAGDAFAAPDCLDFLATWPDGPELIHADAIFEAAGQRFSFVSRIEGPASFVRQNPFCHQSLFYRREALVRLGGYDPAYRVSADFDLTYRYVRTHGQRRHCGFVARFALGGFGRRHQLGSLRERLRCLRRNGPLPIYAVALLGAPVVLAKFALLALLEPTGGLALYRSLRTHLHASRGRRPTADGRIEVLGVRIAPARVAEHGVVSFVNPFSIVQVARSDLGDADLGRITFYSDGIALCRLAGWLNRRPVARLSFDFSSLAGAVLGDADRQHKRLAVIGARAEANRRFVAFLADAYPGIACVYSRDGYFAAPAERTACAGEVATLAPDLVIVGLGAGLQERFGLELVAAGCHAVVYTCGGFIDQAALAGQRYYPAWVDRCNLRWLYRLVREPRRLLPRYLIEYPRFVWYYLRHGAARP